MSQDYYETLQVHPKADADAIKAAYDRLRGMYDPARLDGVAEELVAIARQRLERIESAYAVLSDPQQTGDAILFPPRTVSNLSSKVGLATASL